MTALLERVPCAPRACSAARRDDVIPERSNRLAFPAEVVSSETEKAAVPCSPTPACGRHVFNEIALTLLSFLSVGRTYPDSRVQEQWPYSRTVTPFLCFS